MPRVVVADIENDVTPSFAHGSKSSISTTAVQMITTSTRAFKGVLVKASTSNTGTIYVGSSSGVTADGGDSSSGFPLAAGESLLVPTDDASDIWLIATAAGHKIFFAVA